MRPALLVLAIVAALFGAPLPAFAAANELRAPAASPTSGSTATVFTLRVAYEGRFAARTVTASVAGTTLPMERTTGTPRAGTWSVSTTLPAGSWPVSFAATVERGSAPAIDGPTLTVAAVASATVPATPDTGTPGSGGRGIEAPSSPVPVVGPGAPRSARPAPASPPVAGPAATPTPVLAPHDSPIAVPPAGSGPAPAPVATPAGGAGTDGGGGRRPVASPSPAAAAPSPAAVPAATEPSAELAGEALPERDDGLVTFVLLVGIAGVAAIALIGAALLALGRRRPDPAGDTAGRAAAPVDPGTATDAILERRQLRRAKVRLPNDPILASLGIDQRPRPKRRERARDGEPPPRDGARRPGG